MEIIQPSPESAADQVRALGALARAATNSTAAPQMAFLAAAQTRIFRTELDLDAMDSIEAAVLADHELDSKEARQLIRFMVVMCIADGPPSAQQMQLLESYAEALGVDEPAVGVIAHLAKGRELLFKLSFARRSHVRIYFRNTRRLLGGVLPTVKAILRFDGVLGENREMANRFRALAALPGETLGNQFFHHCRNAELPFSGEQGGFPPGALYHDFTHVLAGYDTTPEGEIKASAFQAGFTQDPNDFFTALFGLIIHTTGINLTPFPMPVEPGRIGQGDLASDMLHALERGAQMKVDLSGDWDFWEDLELPIDRVREKLGVVPMEASV